nr:hypothetical protein [Lachnoclostridium phytofermentans]
MKKIVLYIILLLLLLSGCEHKNRDTHSDSTSELIPEMNAVVNSKTDINSFDVDDNGNIYYCVTAETGEYEVEQLEEGNYIVTKDNEYIKTLSKPIKKTTLYILDSDGNTSASYLFNEELIPNNIIYSDNSILYTARKFNPDNKEAITLCRYNFGEENTEIIFEFDNLSNIISMEKIDNYLYIIGTNLQKKESDRFQSNDYYEPCGEELMSLNLDTMSYELILFERPTILSKTPDNKLLIYGYEEGRGFYFTTYDPVNKSESSRIYKEYPLMCLTACDKDAYIFTSSVNPTQSITIGSLKTNGVIELPTNDFILKKSKYKNGVFYYIDQNKITKVDISGNLDFSNINPIHIISSEFVTSMSPSYGYQLDFKQLKYDEFALTVLSLDKSYDISYAYTNQDFAANLRDKGSFYPLNNIEGVQEYINACFPALKEVAINKNGEIWMLPIYMQVPCVVFNKDLCRDLNIKRIFSVSTKKQYADDSSLRTYFNNTVNCHIACAFLWDKTCKIYKNCVYSTNVNPNSKYCFDLANSFYKYCNSVSDISTFHMEKHRNLHYTSDCCFYFYWQFYL